MFILDTNVVSELRKLKMGRAAPPVVRWAGIVPTHHLFLSAISAMELEVGVLRAERRNPQQGAMLRGWLEQDVKPNFSGRILSIDLPVAVKCASLHIPAQKPERDALIGTTALVHGMTVVTRNIRDFSYMGVKLLNPWND
jgi:predicted nucleic acid-binding protein